MDGSSALDLFGNLPLTRYSTILADPPWQFANRTGKMAPEHKRLSRYRTMTVGEIKSLPIGSVAATPAHLYLWVPNALLGRAGGYGRLGLHLQDQSRLA